MWHECLREQLRADAPPGLCVAFSGGPDSTALLHALVQMPEARGCGLRALHVDHGLHADSAAWAEHCTAFCASLGIPLTVARVDVDDARGEGIEAAARHARYAAFSEHLRNGEWLALAHHRDDQIETVLLKLLRGAGPEGLSGMRELRPFGSGCLWRPLLDVPRAKLRGYVDKHGLPYLDDPANEDPRFSRNTLRNEILPRITRRWPHANASILHTARLCRVTSDFITREATTALTSLRHPDGSLAADDWLALHEAIRVPTLHHWLHERGLTTPTDTQRRELERQAAKAAEDAVPCIAWADTEVRIWDGHLHATPPLQLLPYAWQAAWDGTPMALPADCGTLVLAASEAAPQSVCAIRFDPALAVRLRRGGERIKPVGDPHTRELRDLYQRARIPPWLRARCPLIFEDNELIAVAGLWANERGQQFFAARNASPRWLRPAWA